MTQTLAPTLMMVAEALDRIPAKTEVSWTMRNTAKLIPTSSAANLPRSFTSSLNATFRIPVIVEPPLAVRRPGECSGRRRLQFSTLGGPQVATPKNNETASMQGSGACGDNLS